MEFEEKGGIFGLTKGSGKIIGLYLLEIADQKYDVAYGYLFF